MISKRLHQKDSEKREFSYMYYVNDGVYGSFNCILYDHNIPSPAVLKVGYDGCEPPHLTPLVVMTFDPRKCAGKVNSNLI